MAITAFKSGRGTLCIVLVNLDLVIASLPVSKLIRKACGVLEKYSAFNVFVLSVGWTEFNKSTLEELSKPLDVPTSTRYMRL